MYICVVAFITKPHLMQAQIFHKDFLIWLSAPLTIFLSFMYRKRVPMLVSRIEKSEGTKSVEYEGMGARNYCVFFS